MDITPAVTTTEEPAALETEKDNEKGKEDTTPRPGRKKVYNMEPRTPLKRQRIPVQRFQSPVLEDGAPKPKIPTEEKILLFKKGAFLAVRNPEGSFYICKAQQIVYRSSKRFRIQWLNMVQPPDVYKLDYMDATELECVLCDVKMDRVEKDTYRLHFTQVSRAEKSLKKVMNLERGLPINEGIDDDEPILKRKKVVESSPKPSPKEPKVTPKGKGKTEKTGKRKGGGRNPDKKLKPNPNIVVLDKEPFFETNEAVPFISAQVNGKLAIRAVLLNDMNMLKSLTHGLDYLRSPNNKHTALHYAIQRQNRGAVIYLAEDYFSSNRKSSQQKKNFLIKSMNTGSYNPTFLGIRHIRSITIGRGNREGNNSLTKDVNEDVMYLPENFFEYAVTIGASKEILELLFEANLNETRDEQLSNVYQNIHLAIIKGHRKLAGKLIEEAEKAGGHGYNYLHKEVLLFEKEDLRTNILPASVKKKPFYSKITPLHCAAINPNVKYLQTLVGVEPDINVVDKWQRRPIHYAAACVSSAPLEYLLEKHANPCDEDSSAMNAIHFAAQAGRPQNVEILIKRAKNLGGESDIFASKYGPGGLNRPNRYGYCPLHLAITNGHTEVVKVLVKHQVDVNKPLTASKGKLTPLMIAADKGHLEIARLLVGQKAFIEQTDKYKRTALTHAAMNGNTHLVSYFLSLGADPNHTDYSGNSVVHYAAAYGWFFSLKLLVANGGANPNHANDWKMTPVCIAFLKGHFGLVDLLLNQPAVDINFRDDRGRTLVSLAVSSKLVPGLMDQLTYLLNKKADCSIADLEGCNPLHYLARNMQSKSSSTELPDADLMKVSVDVANFLIENGCDPTARSTDGITPLMLAIEKNNVLLVKTLLQKKGSVSLDKNKNNKNILHMMAELCTKGDMSSILRDVVDQTKKTSDETTAMEIDGDSSTPSQDKDILKKLSKMVDNEGFTPLLRACQKYKHLQVKMFSQNNESDLDKARANARSFIVMLIDEAGSDVNSTVQKKSFKDPLSLPESEEDQYVQEGKWSAVHFMVSAVNENSITTDGAINHCPGLKLLLSKKPKLDLQDIQGCVPLIQAINLNRPYAVKLLLLAGANPNCSWSEKQVTPLLLVAQNGKPELVKMLVDAHANLNVTNALTQQTALHLACQNRARDADALRRVQILTEAGAKVNVVDNKGLTPLHCAVKNNGGELDSSTDMEELLIKIGADVFVKDKRNRLPLHYAFGDMDSPSFTTADPIELVQTLTSAMQHRLIDDPEASGLTTLHRAACRGATICCRHLMRMNADTNRKDCYGNTPLAYAVRYNHDSCAIMLLQQGASVKENVIIPPAADDVKKEAQNADRKRKPIWKWQPIRNIINRPEKKVHPIFQEAIASELQNVAYVMLDSNGMDLRSGIESALCVSKYNVALRLIKKVHDMGRLQSTNADGRNLLHMLALQTKPGVDTEAQLKIARILLEKGVSLNQTDMYGCTPLMYAALMHQPYRLGHLMSSRNPRLDIKHKDRHGRDVMAAFFWHYDKVSDIDTEAKDWLKMLMSLDASLDILFDLPPPHPLLFGEQVTFQRMNYFTRCDGPLITPLIFAICSYNINLVRYLLKNGASPNFADEKGLTPIMHAVKKNDINIVKLLLNYDYHPEQNTEVTKLDLPKMPSQQLFSLKITTENKTPAAGTAQANGNGSAVDELLPEVVSVMAEEGTDATDKVDDIENGASDMSDTEVNDVESQDGVASGDNSNDEKEGDTEEDDDDDDNYGNDFNDDDDADDTDEVDDEENNFQLKPPICPRLNSKASFMLKQGNQSSFSFRFDNIPTVEKTSIVNINCIDNDGRTVLHHLVCPLEYGTYDNDEILYVLFKAGAPLEFEDTAGLSPLKHALINGAPRLARMLQKLTGVERDKWEKPTFNCLGEHDGISNTLPNVDYGSDSKAMESQLLSSGTESSNEEKEFLPQPDENCNIRASSEVVSDSSQSMPFDVLLTKVDVCCGVWGMYNFYKMQIVREKSKDLYVLFTRWGRIGDRGQFQHTPFFSIEEASKEFCKIFKAKTGNEWSKINLFKNHPKKYRLVQTEDRLKGKKQPAINYDLNSDLPSKLSPRLQELIKELSSVKMLSSAYSMCGIDTDILPFGQIKKEALLNALKILQQLRDLIEIVEKTKGSAAQVQDYQTTCENIAKLSNEYFHLVPQAGYEYEKIRPIHDKRSLKNHLRKITNLLDYEMASRILLGAQYRMKEMNPLDYIYKAIGCHIKLMSENELETQYILKYIYSTDNSVKVHAIYRLSRGGEEERVQELNLENRMLLWHGSRVPNFISILSRGLLISPPEAHITGHMFGEGIYTADTFTKAKNYCYHSNVGTNCMFSLLCEVALGKMKTTKVGGDSLNASDVEYNSVVGVGREIPDSAFDVTLPYGATLPLGPLISNPTAKSRSFLEHNEYIVYDPAQVCQRYLVQFSD